MGKGKGPDSCMLSDEDYTTRSVSTHVGAEPVEDISIQENQSAFTSASSSSDSVQRGKKADRIRELREIFDRNPDATNSEISEEMGVSSARVSQLRKEAGIPGKRGRPSKQSQKSDWEQFQASIRRANEIDDWRH